MKLHLAMNMRVVAVFFAALVGSVTLAAGSGVNDTATSTKLAQFTAAGPNGARLRLSDVTDFEWDTVRSYSATAPIALYWRDLGASFQLDGEIVRQLTDDSAVLVFLNKGQIVRQVVIGPPVFLQGSNGSARDPQHAILTVTTRDPGPYSAIGFVD